MEPHKEPVLDLDVVDRRSPRSGDGLRYWWRRLGVSARVPLLVALGLFLFGGAIGGVGVHVWDLRQQLQAEQSTASVVVFGDTAGPMMASGEGPRVRIDGPVTVVNAGRSSVNVQNLAGSAQGVALGAIDKQRWIAPGGWSTVDLTATVDCATGLPAGPIALRLSVQTDDDRFSQVSVPVTLQDTRWEEVSDQACGRAG